jgi:hypothetical protein
MKRFLLAMSALALCVAGLSCLNAETVYTAGLDSHSNACYWIGTNETVLEGPGGVVNALTLSKGRIYMAGSDKNSVPSCWIGTNKTVLDKSGRARGIAVFGGTVYVCGKDQNGDACYWTGNKKTVLDKGGEALAILPTEEGIVAAGEDTNGDACYWKGGKKTVLPSVSGKGGGFVKALAVLDGTIITAGEDLQTGVGSQPPCYWKGVKEIPLNQENPYGSVNSLFVYKRNLYFGGQDETPCVWFGNQMKRLADDGGEVMSIYVYKDTVYAAGYVGEHLYSSSSNPDSPYGWQMASNAACYWKGDKQVVLDRNSVNSSFFETANAIYVVEDVFDGARDNDADFVQSYLAKGGDVNAVSDEGRTALMEASKGGAPETFRLLLNAKANINISNSIGENALILAAENHHDGLVQRLLKSGATVDVYSAAAIGNTNFLAKYLADGGKLDVTDINLWTPLMEACQDGQIVSARFLLKAGADVRLADKWGNTALITAATHDNADIVKLLIDYHSDINARNQNGDDPMLLAAWTGKGDAIRYLTAAGADVNTTNRNGDTPLILASCTNLDALNALISGKAGVDVGNSVGNTALLLAANSGRIDMVKSLLRAHASPDLANQQEITPLMLACDKGKLDCVKALVKAGANVNSTNLMQGFTPLSLAKENGNADVVEFLIQAGAK